MSKVVGMVAAVSKVIHKENSLTDYITPADTANLRRLREKSAQISDICGRNINTDFKL